MGQRIAKHQYAGNAWEKSTYYVRDAQGNVLATYNKENPGTATMKVTERDIYGSSRVGMYKKEVEMISASTPSATAFQHETGLRQYELSNHLGNVLAVVTDRKRPLDLGDYDVSGDGINDTNTSGGAADNRTDYYQAEIVMSGDYSPFGVALDGRTFSSADYRYGFQNQEIDNEIKGDGNSVNFTYRMHDPRLGRFLSTDPLTNEFPYWSPYAFSGNRVIDASELEGLEPRYNIRSMYWVLRDEKGNSLSRPKLHVDLDIIITVRLINMSSETMDLKAIATELNSEHSSFSSGEIQDYIWLIYSPINGSNLGRSGTSKEGKKVVSTASPYEIEGTVRVFITYKEASSLDEVKSDENVIIYVNTIIPPAGYCCEIDGLTVDKRVMLVEAKAKKKAELLNTSTHEVMHTLGVGDGYNPHTGKKIKPPGNLMRGGHSGYDLDSKQYAEMMAEAVGNISEQAKGIKKNDYNIKESAKKIVSEKTY